MKKIIGILSVSSLLLFGCGENTDDQAESSEAEVESENDEVIDELENRISELETENEEIKVENEELVSVLDEVFADVEETEENADDSSNYFSFEDTIEFNTGEAVTILSLERDDSIELHDPSEGEYPVVLTATIENETNSSVDFNAQSFDVYDSNLELGRFDASTYNNNIPHSIAAGMNATVEVHFSVKTDSPYYASYGDAIWESE